MPDTTHPELIVCAAVKFFNICDPDELYSEMLY